MVVSLQTEDGKIRKYPTTFFVGTGEYSKIKIYISKCGKSWQHYPEECEECDHLDCAVYAAKERYSGESWFKKFLTILFALNISIILLYYLFDIEDLPAGAIVPGLYISMGIVLLAGHIGDKKKLNQLVEFRDRGTINSIKAWQIHEYVQFIKPNI